MRINKLIKLLIVSVIALLFVACSTSPKGELSSSANPRDEIERLSNDLNIAKETNVDVLAPKDYMKSYKYLEKAKKDLAQNKDQEKIIDDLRYGRESLKIAYSTAENRKNMAVGLFEARQKAIQAGASRSSKFKKEWNSIDEDVVAHADKFDKISPEDLAGYQARYVKLEKEAVIEGQLGKTKAQINGARSDGAAKSAPIALRMAEISVKNAESLIGSNISNPAGYKQSVFQAINDANYLSEVTVAVKQNGVLITEAAAAKIVSQKRQISNLKNNLAVSEVTISEAESELDSKDQTLAEKDIALSSAQTSVEIQGALEKSRQQFSPNEAEAYQQGEHLLIRLKAMNFKSGRSELPTQSILLLAKVSAVAKSLNAKEIKIEGHTDSIGTLESNKKLSEQRANSVATYFKANGFEDTQVFSEGHSFENPIATNKSKEGRAQNRRVDIIITPEGNPKRTQ